MAACSAWPIARAADCPGPLLHFEPLAADVWLVPTASGDSDAGNRGQVSNLVLVREPDRDAAQAGRAEQAGGADAAARWWLLGSGPSPAFGRTLACQLQQRLGGAVSDVISPWARPELVLAPGMLDGHGLPDGRDADLALLRDASRRLAAWAAADGPSARFVGEQGPVMDSAAPARHAAYWDDLLAAATAAVGRGDDEAAPAPGWPGLPAGWAAQPWHGFNWQRAWRQVEPQVLATPPRR